MARPRKEREAPRIQRIELSEKNTRLRWILAGALLVIFYSKNVSLAAGAAILGVTVSCLVSSVASECVNVKVLSVTEERKEC